MLRLVLVLVLAAFVSRSFADAVSYESNHDGYDRWAKLHSKAENPSHRQFSVWLDNNAFVKNVNSAGSTWTAEMNKFSDLTTEEFKNQILMKNSLNVDNDYHKDAVAKKRLGVDGNGMKKASDVASFDWRNVGGVTPVQDQGFVGTCWSFSTVANIEGQVRCIRQAALLFIYHIS